MNTLPTEKTKILALNPFVFHTLSRKKKVGAQSNNPGSRADLRTSVLSIWIDNDTEKGTVSLMPRLANKTFSVINSTSKHVHVHDAMAGKLMCAGEFFTKKDSLPIDSFLLNSIILFGKAARLIDASNDLSHIHNLSEPALFGALSLIVTRNLGDYHRLSTRFPEIETLLRCKIFPTKRGVPVSAFTLTQSFENPTQELHENAPTYQGEWLDSVLNSQLTVTIDLLSEPQNKLSWKEHLLHNDESISADAWLICFVSDLMNCNVIFTKVMGVNMHFIEMHSAAQHLKYPLHKHHYIAINRTFLTPFIDHTNRTWLAMEVLTELRRAQRIDEPTFRDYHGQIADLILEKSDTNINSLTN